MLGVKTLHAGGVRLHKAPRYCPARVFRVSCSVERSSPSTAVRSTMKKEFRGICTSITASKVQEARKQLKEAEEAKADLVELRLDYLTDFKPNDDLGMLLKSSALPCIVTYRPIWEGGNYQGDEGKRLEVLREAVDLGAEFVDVELKAAADFLQEAALDRSSSRLILSHHDFEGTPSLEEMEELVKEMRVSGADIAKLATTVEEISECRRLFKVLQGMEGAGIVLGMGGKGLMTRVLAKKYGGFLTFGALKKGQESAPGQPTIEDLRDLYDVHSINQETKIFGVCGNPVFHSKGPVFFNTRMKKIGFNGVYMPFLVDDFDKFVNAFRDDTSFAGYSITVPHKEPALKLADSVDDTTRKIGASNTYVRGDDGTFSASNTDWPAAIGTIEKTLGEPLAGKSMVVVGAGGVSKALAFGGATKGCKIIIANRTQTKAEDLAKKIPNSEVVSLKDLQKGLIHEDILANGTTIGMAPKDQETPVPKSTLKNFKLVFDAVYTPKDTRLLVEAEEMGCKVANGLDMFVGQAELQFEKFTASKSPSL